MSTPFAMVGDPDAGVCVDGVCALPVGETEPHEDAAAAEPATRDADETSVAVR